MQEIIEFWYGNPSIEVYKGNLKLCEEITGKFCITDIPTSLILSDLCIFIKDYLPDIQQIKIFRTTSSKLYCCAILLTDLNLSTSFALNYKAKPFNTIEDHICHIVNIQSWDCESSDLFSVYHDKCPICLEELDKPVLSILCGHLFHVKCLEMWSDTTCPVCRYHQTPPDTSQCDTCGEEADVRMCLICGELGCPVHAVEHFESTSHTYFKIIETSVTWDYSRQISISRLVTSNDKIVEVHDSKKIENLMFEYNCLLSSLLETQREYYENKIREIEENLENPLIVQLKSLKEDNQKLAKKIDEYDNVNNDLQELDALILRENQLKKRLEEENLKLSKETEHRVVFRVTKEVNDEIKELEIQIKEMNFYIKTQNRLKDVGIESIEIRKKK
jgi:BRCA1-associated protein